MQNPIPISAAPGCAPANASLSMARLLPLPAPVTEALEALCPRIPWQTLAPLMEVLCGVQGAQAARQTQEMRQAPLLQNAQAAQQTLAAQLAPIEGGTGLAQLAVHLAAAEHTRQRYRAAGADETVFIETMRCFSRFLTETHTNTGRWAFDRAFWTWRQLSCRLFRLGALEFEYRTADEAPPPGLKAGDALLAVHIPSDARLTDEALCASYAQMRRFFAEEGAVFCTQGAPKAVTCGTWLLAPALQPLLPAGSGIRRFASDYALYAVDENDGSFYQWLFGGSAPVGQLPERTSLQRAVKKHLSGGGKIGSARGVLRSKKGPQNEK